MISTISKFSDLFYTESINVNPTYSESKVKLWNAKTIGSLQDISLKIDIGYLLVPLNEVLTDLFNSIQVVMEFHELNLSVGSSTNLTYIIEVFH